MLDSITATNLIKSHMPVVGIGDGQLAVVDHLEGTDSIKLARDAEGKHHYVPLAWVTSVDDQVHLDRTAEQARKDWSDTPVHTDAPSAGRTNSVDATAGQPLVERVMARKAELEQALAALPAGDSRARGDLALALSTITGLLTGDLAKIPPTVGEGMSRWLEQNKHLAETAVAPAAAAREPAATSAKAPDTLEAARAETATA